MLSQQSFQVQKHYGRIIPLSYGYYRNPQMCMFIFTLILTVSMSLVMIINIFTNFYNRCISIVLCLYIAYRFISLGLSNPGLAVQSSNDDEEVNQNRIIQDNILIQNNQNSEQDKIQLKQRQEKEQNMNQPQIKQNLYSRQNQNFHNYCHYCKIPTKRYTRHCQICQTCIEGHDHHCIWIGKCIGKNNMWQFKQFLCFTFGVLIYALVISLQTARIYPIKK